MTNAATVQITTSAGGTAVSAVINVGLIIKIAVVVVVVLTIWWFLARKGNSDSN